MSSRWDKVEDLSYLYESVANASILQNATNNSVSSVKRVTDLNTHSIGVLKRINDTHIAIN